MAFNPIQHVSFRKVGLFSWYALVFLQPFNQFGALRILSMFMLLVCLAGEFWMTRPSVNTSLASRIAIAIALWITISSLIGPYPLDSLNTLRKDLLVQALMLIAALTYLRTPADIWRLIGVALAGFATVTLFSLIEIGRYWAHNGLSLWIKRGHSSFWGGYASTGAVYLPLFVGWLVAAPKNRRWLVPGWTTFAVMVLLILLYGSRSPLLAAIISTLVLLSMLKQWRSMALVAVLIGGAIGLIQVLGQSEGRFQYDTLLKGETYITNSGLSARLAVWDGCWQVIQERPLTGYGYGWKKLAWVINEGPYAERWASTQADVAAYYLQDGKASYGKVNPHNYLLQVIFEIGMGGLFLVLLFWAEIMRQSVTLIRRSTPEAKGLAISLFVVLLGYALSNLGNGHWVGGLANLALAFAGCVLALNRSLPQAKLE